MSECICFIFPLNYFFLDIILDSQALANSIDEMRSAVVDKSELKFVTIPIILDAVDC